MSVAVYPRLAQLLREHDLTPAELGRIIESRYGVAVDGEALARLSSGEPAGHADLAVAGAAALGVGFGDLFEVAAVPVSATSPGEETYLDEVHSRRLAELLDRQDRNELTAAERQELDQLVGEYGRQFAEQKLTEHARRQGVPLEQARREADEAVAAAAERWRQLAAEGGRRHAAQRLARSS
jgi:hypothetical protein